MLDPSQYGLWLQIIRSGQMSETEVIALIESEPEFWKWYETQLVE